MTTTQEQVCTLGIITDSTALTITTLLILLAFGLIIGSFINAAAYRIPHKETLMTRSHCVQCDHQIAWYDNIPVISYLVLGGKCRHCRQKISIRYPLIEALTGILTAGLGAILLFANNIPLVQNVCEASSLVLLPALFIILWASILLTIIDLKHQLLPSKITIWTAILSISLSLVLITYTYFVFNDSFDYQGLQDALIYSVIGAVALSIFYFTIIMIAPRGMGLGDVKLSPLIGGIAGAYAGLSGFIIATFAGFLIAGIIGISMMLFNKKTTRKTKVPFGPFMIIGLWVAILFSQPITEWYLSLL